MAPRKRSVLSVLDLTMDQIDRIVTLAHRVLGERFDLHNLPHRLIIGILFEQQSHRTKNSFLSAAFRLGLNVIDLTTTYLDSSARGESLADFCRTAECYTDCLVVRSSISTLVSDIDDMVNIPVINAGNGRKEHPTQALADFSVLKKSIEDLHNMTIAMIGCLRDSRCANSLAFLLAPFGPRITMVCPKHLAITEQSQTIATERGAIIKHSENISDVLDNRVLYFTGALPEDFSDPSDYIQYRDSFTLEAHLSSQLFSNAFILHPLPRGNELPTALDMDVRFQVFAQVRHGLAIRCALLADIFDSKLI